MRTATPVKIAIITLLSIIIYNTSRAQSTTSSRADSTRAQSIFFELGGPGLLFSANYDTRFSQRRDGFGGRIGLGFIASNGSSLVSVPVQLNYLLGKNSKYFEIGVGASYVSFSSGSDFLSFNSTPTTSHTVLGTMTFGYRYQPIDGGFNFRASFNPIFDSSNFVPFGGISVGYTF
jgi:hypothetical protein